MNEFIQARQERIAEETTSLIDFTSRVLGAVEDGNWHYAHDKLTGLRRAVDALERQVDPKHKTELAQIPKGAVWSQVTREMPHYWLGRAIVSFGKVGR